MGKWEQDKLQQQLESAKDQIVCRDAHIADLKRKARLDHERARKIQSEANNLQKQLDVIKNRISEIERFNKLFKKGEQIYIGFRNGYTHGFVSSVTIDGFGIVQINNPKEYVYGWEQFEFICHPGFKVTRANDIEAVHLFDVHLRPNCKPNDPIKSNRLEFLPTFTESDDILIETQLELKPEELSVHDRRSYIWELEPRLTIDINGMKGVIRCDVKKLNNQWYTYSSICSNEIYKCFQMRGGTELHKVVGDVGYEKIIDSRTSLEEARNNINIKSYKIERKINYFGGGDPWIFEADYLDNRIWKQKNGYLMGNRFCDIYLKFE